MKTVKIFCLVFVLLSIVHGCQNKKPNSSPQAADNKSKKINTAKPSKSLHEAAATGDFNISRKVQLNLMHIRILPPLLTPGDKIQTHFST